MPADPARPVPRRQIPTAVVLSLYTGRLLCDFSAMHEFAEYLVGDSVFTHQFAFQPFVDEMKRALAEQHPELASIDASAVTKENWMPFLSAQVQRFGPTLAIRPMGEPEHAAAAFTEPLKGKSVVVVETDK